MSQLPGFTEYAVRTPREILISPSGANYVAGVLDGSKGIDGGNTVSSEIRAGWLLGLITASKKWVPCKRTKCNGGATSDDVTVDNAAAFKAGDVITVGGDSGKTILSVDYSTNTITIDASITFVDDEAVYAEDGSGTARGILSTYAKLRDPLDQAAADQACTILVSGFVSTPMVLGDYSVIRAALRAATDYLAGVIWSDEHGLS